MELRLLSIIVVLTGLACSGQRAAVPASTQKVDNPPKQDVTAQHGNDTHAPEQNASAGASGTTRSSERQPTHNATLPSGTTVLHVGDSFAGALGLDLNRELKEAGIRSVLKYQTASYIPTWAWGKDLATHIANYNPDLVIVTLGANDLDIPDPEQRTRAIKKIVSTIGARPCVWVGLPLWPKARPALLEVVRAQCAPCLFLDSTANLPNLARARDGIHPSGPARSEWAKLVVQWLAERIDPRSTRAWGLKSAE